jgi:hypothetical protein
MFFTCNMVEESLEDVCSLDSGCRNHMIRNKKLLSSLDESSAISGKSWKQDKDASDGKRNHLNHEKARCINLFLMFIIHLV